MGLCRLFGAATFFVASVLAVDGLTEAPAPTPPPFTVSDFIQSTDNVLGIWKTTGGTGVNANLESDFSDSGLRGCVSSTDLTRWCEPGTGKCFSSKPDSGGVIYCRVPKKPYSLVPELFNAPNDNVLNSRLTLTEKTFGGHSGYQIETITESAGNEPEHRYFHSDAYPCCGFGDHTDATTTHRGICVERKSDGNCPTGLTDANTGHANPEMYRMSVDILEIRARDYSFCDVSAGTTAYLPLTTCYIDYAPPSVYSTTTVTNTYKWSINTCADSPSSLTAPSGRVLHLCSQNGNVYPHIAILTAGTEFGDPAIKIAREIEEQGFFSAKLKSVKPPDAQAPLKKSDLTNSERWYDVILRQIPEGQQKRVVFVSEFVPTPARRSRRETDAPEGCTGAIDAGAIDPDVADADLPEGSSVIIQTQAYLCDCIGANTDADAAPCYSMAAAAPSPSPSPSPGPAPPLSGGAIAGIVIGSVVGVGAIVGGLIAGKVISVPALGSVSVVGARLGGGQRSDTSEVSRLL